MNYIMNDTNKALSLMAGYFEAAQWTEDLKTETVDKESWNKIYQDCFKFVRLIADSKEYQQAEFTMDWQDSGYVSLMGHDLWLTRNGHGAGFWDKPEKWLDCADLFTEMAKSMGESYAYAEGNVLFFE